MLALIERPPLLWPEYAITYPKDFFELVDFHSPKYVRSLFSHNHESKTKTFLLGNSKSKRVTDLKTFKCKTSRFVQGILNRESEAVNIYFSPNEFFNWPRDKGLALFRANWLDIDITEKLDVPNNLLELVKNNQKAFLALKIVEIIGEDEPHQLDSETIFFVTNLLNKMNLVTIRNKVLNSALPKRI